MSIVSGKKVRIRDCVVANTFGHMPMSGIDIEPNTNEDEVQNVIIENPGTFNNAMHGIVVSLGGLMGSHQKNASLIINNHIDEGSQLGLGLVLTRKKSLGTGPAIHGELKINNPCWIDNRQKGFQYYKSPQNGIAVRFKNVKIIKNAIPDEAGLKEMTSATVQDQKITFR